MGFSLKDIPGLSSVSEEEQQDNQVAEQTSGSLNFDERVRLSLQGLLYNFSDEGIARIKSLTSDLSYDDALAAERKILEEARAKDPTGALVTELGGALIPSLITLVATGGTGIPAVFANLARIGTGTGIKRLGKSMAIGAGEGMVAGAGASEEEGFDRVTDKDTLISAGAGGVLRPSIQKAGKTLKQIGGAIADRNFVRKVLSGLGKTESAELGRIISETDLTVDDIISRAADGEVIGDMSDSTRMALRAAYANAGPGREQIAETLVRRGSEKPTEAMSTFQTDLSPQFSSGNILKYFDKSIEKLKADESKAYDEIFAIGATSEKLNDSVLEVLTSQKSIRPQINKLFEAKRIPLPYRINKKTKLLELTRDIDLETAEIIRRSLKDISDKAYSDSKGALGGAISDLEKELRTALDDVSPDLKNTRETWRLINQSADAFKEGRNILKKDPDEVEIIFEDLLAKNNMDAVAAFRQGYATALRAKKSVSNVTTLFANLNEAGRREQQILNTIYPGDSLYEAVKKINLADAAMKTRNKVLGQSITASQQAAERKVGTASNIANLFEMITSPTRAPFAAMRFLRDNLGEKMDNLSSEQRTQIAKMLVEEDPDVLRSVLQNENVLGNIASKYNSIADSLISGVARGSNITASEDIQQGEAPRVIKSIAGNLGKQASEKVLRAVGN
tara:strand:- start:18 stop:2054 length:2037 start_codon:yes stop_codon:yes gene_type:complete